MKLKKIMSNLRTCCN